MDHPLIVYGFVTFLLIRILQRLYFVRKGHKHHHWSNSPKKEMEKLLKNSNVQISHHTLQSSLDQVDVTYHRLGKGKRFYLLENGVGTGFFIWLPVIRALLEQDPNLFDEITLLVSDYRGMFMEEGYVPSSNTKDVQISVHHCMTDIRDIMKHTKVDILDGIIGWSTGAQIGLAFCVNYPKNIRKLILFNPSVGRTLRTALQPFHPLPASVGDQISYWLTRIIKNRGMKYASNYVWTYVKVFVNSVSFSHILNLLCFSAGYPPDTPTYFYEYMKDALSTRTHTKGLLNLILSLDEELPIEIFDLSLPVMIFSASSDFLTGVYHSKNLEKRLTNCRRVDFTLGSHWLILEWPEVVAKYLIPFFLNEASQIDFKEPNGRRKVVGKQE
jgi:pimeloyl-ACP methyl ester carboxylesterase